MKMSNVFGFISMVFVALTIWASLEGEESSTVLALGLAIYHILVAIYCRVGGEWVTHTSRGYEMMKYDIVRSCDEGGMVEEVNRRTKKGWEPLGGPFVTNDRYGNYFYHQAITWAGVVKDFSHLAEQASRE